MTDLPNAHAEARDFIGYGGRPPSVQWPAGKQVAVSFVLNVEEGAEFCVGEGDARNEAIYEVVDRQAGRDFCIESHFEYGTRVAYWRIAELLSRHAAPVTVSACGRAVERSPWLIRDAIERGHEISAHGYRWETHAHMNEADERIAIDATIEAIRAVTGKAPVGWHTRSIRSANTRLLLAEKGFLYDSDAYNDDTPYFVQAGSRQHLVLPYSFDTNDMQFLHANRFSTAASFAEYVCDAYDWLRQEDAPRMLSIGLHLRMIGRPARMSALARILDHLAARGDAWIATREQIARHWIAETGGAALTAPAAAAAATVSAALTP